MPGAEALIDAQFGGLPITNLARIETRNHTPAQVIMGVLVGTLPVLIVFPLVL